MSFTVNRAGSLEYLTAGNLRGRIVHCFSTRLGGVSRGDFESLNLGTHRGDAPENVWENYRILGQAVGFYPEDTVFTRQLHGVRVVRVGRADRGAGLRAEVAEERDGLITIDSGVALVVFSADCTPVLLHDPVTGGIGAVHSGWRGTAGGIVRCAVQAMQREFGTNPADLQAAIGPCIGACCFETDRDVPEAMLAQVGPEAACAISRHGEKYHVDLKAINRLWLLRCGVTNIDVSGECTCCQPERFWSHRRVGNRRGSLAAVIMRKEAEIA